MLQYNDCDCGAMDRVALLKTSIVFIISFFGLIYYCCFLRLCDDAGIGNNDCLFTYFGGDMNGHTGVPVPWYVFFYAVFMCISIMGLFSVCCSTLGCNKLYAVSLMVIFFCITIADWCTMGAIGSIYKDSQHLREFYTFQMVIFWFMELVIVISTAMDFFYKRSEDVMVYGMDSGVDKPAGTTAAAAETDA